MEAKRKALLEKYDANKNGILIGELGIERWLGDPRFAGDSFHRGAAQTIAQHEKTRCLDNAPPLFTGPVVGCVAQISNPP